jgi:hypothetical protein
MPIGNREKMYVHIYRDLAGMKELRYRQLLQKYSGCESVADRDFDPVHFRLVMAALEAALFERVASGEIPSPVGTSPYVRDEGFWRDEAAKVDPPGRITSAQVGKINELWNLLRPSLGEKWTPQYFAQIVSRCTRAPDVGERPLNNREAKIVIDALQDKATKALAKVTP